MNIIEAIGRALLYIGALVLCFFLIVWFLGAVGLSLPPHVIQIIMAMLVVVAVMVLARLFAPSFAGWNWFPPRNPPPG